MPKPRAPERKFKPKIRSYVLDKYLEGSPLEGAHVVMGSMTTREFIRLRSGEMDEGAVLEFTATKVTEHDLDLPDIRDLDAEDFGVIANAWASAVKAGALPPAKGDS